jgi:hypothetical protein
MAPSADFVRLPGNKLNSTVACRTFITASLATVGAAYDGRFANGRSVSCFIMTGRSNLRDLLRDDREGVAAQGNPRRCGMTLSICASACRMARLPGVRKR